jgi:predicted SnoaL-like aldol condensation-catalyzing enzyme
MRIRIAAVGLAVVALAGAASSASAQDAEQNKTLFTVVVNQVYNGGDLALVDDLVAKNVSNNGAPLGRDGFKTLVKDERAKDPSRKLKVDDLVADGDRVIGRLTASSGAGQILVLRIQDGQVTEQWTMADEPATRKQFGLREARPATGTSAN